MMTLLEILQEVCLRTGLPKPTVVMASQDDQYLQLVALLNETCEDITSRHKWEGLTRQAVWTSVAGEDQGVATTLFDPGFRKVINDTIFDRTRRLPIFGPRTPEQWQGLKALPMSGPYYQYRFRQGHLLIYPDMAVGHTLACEFMSNAIILATDNTTYKVRFTADDDQFTLPDALALQGLRWRWKKEKGLPYAEEQRAYEVTMAEYFSGDGTKPVVSMNGGTKVPQPGIFVPVGNWNLP